MRYVYTWKNWRMWSLGIHRYGTTRSKNLQIAIGPYRLEFETPLKAGDAPQNVGDLGGKPWQGKKKREKVFGDQPRQQSAR